MVATLWVIPETSRRAEFSSNNRHGDKIIDVHAVNAKLSAEFKRLDAESHSHLMRHDASEYVKNRRARALEATIRIAEARNIVIEDVTARSEVFLAWEKLVTFAVTCGLSSIVAILICGGRAATKPPPSRRSMTAL